MDRSTTSEERVSRLSDSRLAWLVTAVFILLSAGSLLMANLVASSSDPDRISQILFITPGLIFGALGLISLGGAISTSRSAAQRRRDS